LPKSSGYREISRGWKMVYGRQRRSALSETISSSRPLCDRDGRDAGTKTEHSDSKNYYRILGIPPSASAQEVKRAYRRWAKELHPNRHPNDPSATKTMQALNEAHAVISDPAKRAA
jgi:DnaJ-domain-containing protein 1